MIPTDILNYRIVRHLGTGGMGSVFLAVNTNIDQQVAIKALRPEVARNVALRARFKQEAEMLCSLDHPGIVKFLNYVETPDGVFLIMEYVKGMTLEDYINKKNGLIVEKKAYPLICEILDAFAYAHSRGIVHRDIKPSNIIIQENGHIKIMDFGIAQIVSESNALDSKYIMGTPTYMSPEQILGQGVDARSDIYSLGVLIHNMLTGRAPYDSTTLTVQEIKRRVTKEVMPRMSEYYPYISDGIQRVVDRATQKNPDYRYTSCQAMKSEVKKALNPTPIPKPLLYGSIAASVILILGAFFVWDYFRTKIEYYKDYVEVYGVPKGIGSLSSSEMSHREGSYKFEYSRYKLRRVTYVNSRGCLIDHHDSEAKDRIVDMTVSYNEGSGKIDVAKYKNRCGKVLYVKDYDNNFKTCTFKLDDELGTEMTLNANVKLFESSFDILLSDKSKISKYILDYDEDGNLIKVEYAGFGNVKVADGQGIFGKKYVVDKKGRVVEEHYLGKDGKPKATQFGLGIKRFTYDDDDNLVKLEYLTTDGKPSSDGNNCPVVLLTYDEYGNRLSEKYTDINGNPMIRKDDPFAGIIYEYDEDGFLQKFQYLGIDGHITYIHGVSGCINEYDDNGYLKRRSFIDAKGRAAYYNDIENNVSFSRQEFENDFHGNILDFKILDIDGKLVETAGYSHRVCTFDSVGNQLSEYYLNAEGEIYEPAGIRYAGYEAEFDKQGRLSTLSFMGPDKKRKVFEEYGYCYFKNEYDARGNYTKRSYFDNKDQPIASQEGIAAACYEYDDNGNEIARYFLDTKGKPCYLNGSYSRVEYSYDEQGNIISVMYKNTSDKPMAVNGIAGYKYAHDARGNVTKTTPLGVNGKLASGYLEERMKYDERDNVIERTFFGNGGRPSVCSDGYHKVVMAFNSNNQCVQREFYGIDGLLKNVAGQGFAVEKMEYDMRGNNISKTFFTQTGERGKDNSNVHKFYFQFDLVSNKVSHQLTFDCDGKPTASDGIASEGRVTYDKRGNMTALICYDGYGKKINGLKGWCELRFKYDDSGLVTEQAYFTVDGKPTVDTQSKYHKILFKYNELRQKVSQSYYGVNGQPVNTANGWHKEKYYYKNGSYYKCELFDVSNRKISSAIMVNNKWKFQNNVRRNTSNPTDWKLAWRQLAKECPVDSGDGVIIERVAVSDSSVMLEIVFENMTSEELLTKTTDVSTAIKNYLRKMIYTPSHVEIFIAIYDKNHDKVATL